MTSKPPGRLSIELVPRTREALMADAALARDLLPEASVLNVPDLLRMPIRSLEAPALLSASGFSTVIPHIRAIDIDPQKPLPGADDAALHEILVIAGDPPPDATFRTWPNTSADIIARYRRELPHLKVYAAFDPYRRSPREELEEVQRKRDAGAAGFFTQPLFDLQMFDLCANWLERDTVFWGLSPVLGPKSRAYWERVNRIVFPLDFDPSLDGNIAFAANILARASSCGDSAYLMPVRVDLATYLRPLRGIYG